MTRPRSAAPSARTALVADDDVYLFIHVPKAAGLSIISLLDLQFEEQEIFPLHSIPASDALSIYHPDQLKRIKLIRGHMQFGRGDRGLFGHVVQNPVRLTMLRDPVARVMSAYKYCRSTLIVEIHPKRVTVRHGALEEALCTWDQRRRELYETASAASLSQFVVDPRFHDQVYNRQARFVLGASKGFPRSPDDLEALPEQALIQMAIQNLEQFAFVGIVERMSDSIALMESKFGWNFSQHVPHLNESPAIPLQLTEAIRADIEQRNRIDLALYQRAKSILEDDLRAYGLV